MKLDPNDACVKFDENIRLAIIHDLIAHPLLAITGYSRLAVNFHNYTSHKAWQRKNLSKIQNTI